MRRLVIFLAIFILLFFITSCQNNLAVFNSLNSTDKTHSGMTDTSRQGSSPAPAVIDSSNSNSGSIPAATTTPTHGPTPAPTPEPTLTPESASTPVPSTTPDSTPIPASTPVPVSSPAPSSEPTNTYVPLPDGISPEDTLNEIPFEYRQLMFFNPDKAVRYVGYKAQKPDFDYEKVILYVNIGLDLPFYTNINTIKETNGIDILVNKYNKLPDGFVPELEQLPTSICAPGMGNQYLRKEAKEAFEKMHSDAKKIGLNITAFGTYRSIQLQHNIWNGKVNSGRTIEDVDRLNSRGGHSEHHTGLAVDVIKNNSTVENSEEFKWYKDNAHLYGFIIRYPKDKESITGYSYEPWHLRYLGPELASKVYNSNLTYEEYHVKMLK